MKEKFLMLKQSLRGKWQGEGYAKFPTITNTAYAEQLEFIPDDDKEAIFFNQKTWYKNETADNSHTVFWDTGFIILKNNMVSLHSAQIGGRMETLTLTASAAGKFIFDNTGILNDIKTIQAQRIFSIEENVLHYQLNMATQEAGFQNHLTATLRKIQ
ncbi:heme-binding beta-barrel domain-containing protein [Parafilimonas sp.]|uniref:heme-binding beta-barrel domain-containing protein n=1 Tax=Parafilimonas sp. TaxID=1969739 RepID=UPI003F802388